MPTTPAGPHSHLCGSETPNLGSAFRAKPGVRDSQRLAPRDCWVRRGRLIDAHKAGPELESGLQGLPHACLAAVPGPSNRIVTVRNELAPARDGQTTRVPISLPHNCITTYINAEEPGERAQPIENPGLTVRVITTGVGVGAAQESSSDAASDAVINAHALLVDDVAAGRGRHVRLDHQPGAAHYRVYSSEQKWTKIPMRARVSRALRKKLDSKNDLLGANQEFRRPSSRLLGDEPGGSIWTGMPASHEIGGCLPSLDDSELRGAFDQIDEVTHPWIEKAKASA